MKETLIIAHRGASAYAHENTLEAFRIAIEMNADMIETDVRKTSDGVMVLHHDDHIENKLIRELTFIEASGAALDRGYILPTLEETLQFVLGKIKLDLELKEEGYELEVAEVAAKYLVPEDFILTSFSESSVMTIKEHHPEITCGLLMNLSFRKRPRLSVESVLFPLRRKKRTGADFLLPHWDIVKLGFLNRVRGKTEPVFVWTVNDKRMIWDLLNDDMVSGVVTDRPDVAGFFKQMAEKGHRGVRT